MTLARTRVETLTNARVHREGTCKPSWRPSSTQSHSLEKAAAAPTYGTVSVYQGLTQPERISIISGRVSGKGPPCSRCPAPRRQSPLGNPFDLDDVIASPGEGITPLSTTSFYFVVWPHWPILHGVAKHSSTQQPHLAGSVHMDD